jgi:PKD repeat protein
MKRITIIFITVALFFAMQMNAQDHICVPLCDPNESCVELLNPGEVCPEILPTANVGVYYDQTITVIPPATFDIGGTDYDIEKISITAVDGLPTGMDWCKSEEFFTVTDPYTRYCCQITGTSDQVGVYPLTLTIVPYYNLFTISTALPAQTDNTLFIEVLPAAPGADFQANVTTTTTGADVMFTDESSNAPTAWAWVFEGGAPPTSDVQNPTVTYAAEGSYDVTLVVSNDGGSDELTMSDYITIDNGTGVLESIYQKVKVYPNPATHQITVEAEGLKSVSIIDMLGQVVYINETSNEKEVIDISNLGKASYFVKIITNEGEITKSITIK